MASVTVHIFDHDTMADAFMALSRVFPVKTGDPSQWVTLQVGDVEVHFFGPKVDDDVLSAESFVPAES